MNATAQVGAGIAAPADHRPSLADSLPTWAWLALGITLVAASGMRWGIAPLAWIAPVPWLVVTRRMTGWKGRSLLLGLIVLATTLQVFKIITDPIPWVFAPLFGVPIGLVSWMVLLAWDGLRRRTGDVHAIYAFAALAALGEWVGYALTNGGVWGAAANSEIDNLVFLQSASVVGVAGLGFVMAWVAALIAALLVGARPAAGHLGALAAVLMAIFAFGTWRLDQPLDATVRVAAVVTDLGLSPLGLPTAQELEANTDLLFERSALAVDRGARVVVWNEGATVVSADDEAAFLARGSAFARQGGADLVLAYIVPLSPLPEDGVHTGPLQFENKYVWIADDGEILDTYLKHRPVPGEGAVKGTDPIRSLERPYGTVSGAICYDYDFPAIAREHAAVGAGFVALPSSDWRGIDPIHTKMARVRAIESGVNVLRSTRWASSAAIDAHGRIRGWMPVTEDNDRVLVADIPTERVKTVYAALGDLPVAGAGLYLVGLIGLAGWRRR